MRTFESQKATVHTQSITIGLDDVVTCDTWQADGGTESACILAITDDRTESGAKRKRSVTRVIADSLKAGTSESKAFREGSAHFRKLIRRSSRESAPITLAVMNVRPDTLSMAWTGDVYSMRFRNKTHELIARPSRSGRWDGFNPMGNSPALCKRRLQDKDLIVTCSTSIARSIFSSHTYLQQIEDAETLTEATKATSAACKVHGVTTGVFHLARIHAPRSNTDEMGGYHVT